MVSSTLDLLLAPPTTPWQLMVWKTLVEMYRDPPFYRYANLYPRLERSFQGRKIHIYDFADAVEDESGLANRPCCSTQ